MVFLSNLTTFLVHFLECFLAVFAYALIQEHANRHISFFQFMFNPDCYYLSFIYLECRDLRLRGLSVPEIQTTILKKFDDRSFGFLFYPITKKRNLEAVSLARASVENLNLFETYVCTPNFGKAAVKELKIILTTKNGNDGQIGSEKDDDDPAPAAPSIPDNISSSNIEPQEQKDRGADNISSPSPVAHPIVTLPISEDEKEASFAVMHMMVNGNPESASRCMLWLKEKFCHPIPDPDDVTRGITDSENGASIFYAFVPPREKNKREEGVEYRFNSKVTFREFISCINKLKKVYPEMHDIKFSSTSSLSNFYGQVFKCEKRIYAIREDYDRNVLNIKQ